MVWSAVVVLLVECVLASSEGDRYIKFRRHRANYFTMEGVEPGVPSSNAEITKRFLTFNNDESSIRVEIEFSIPMLSIPIGGSKGFGSLWGALTPSVDINVKSLVVASVFFFAAFLIIPKLIRIFLPTENQRRSSEAPVIDRLMQGVENALHVNTTACWQQGVCSLVHSSRDNPSDPGWGTVLDGLSGMVWVQALMKDTALAEALLSVKENDKGCQRFYSMCPLDLDNLGGFTKGLARRYMNQLKQLYTTRTYYP